MNASPFRQGLDQPLPGALWGLLAGAEDALARLDERLRKSPIRDGFIGRTDFQDACASLFLDGKLVPLEDLVLRDARMDIRAPTHELTRAQAVLRARREIAGAAPDWALSQQGFRALRGGGESRADAGEFEEGRGDVGDGPDGLVAGPIDGALAALDHALASSNKILAGDDLFANPQRDPLLYDPENEEAERLEAWRSAALAAAANPPCFAAALVWDA